jgi:hypothetical protein
MVCKKVLVSAVLSAIIIVSHYFCMCVSSILVCPKENYKEDCIEVYLCQW